MTLMPYVCCKKCYAHIWLPFPVEVEGEESPETMKAWPWGPVREYFRCPECLRLHFFHADECRWSIYRQEEGEDDLLAQSLYRVGIPCAQKGCNDLLHFMGILPKDASPELATRLLAETITNGAICDSAHTNFTPSVPPPAELKLVSFTPELKPAQ